MGDQSGLVTGRGIWVPEMRVLIKLQAEKEDLVKGFGVRTRYQGVHGWLVSFLLGVFLFVWVFLVVLVWGEFWVWFFFFLDIFFGGGLFV